MDKLNIEWLKSKPIFYFRYKRQLLESIIEGSCINIGCGSHIIRNAILKLVNEMGYDESLRRGIFWDTELLVRAKRLGFKIKEIPIWWKERNKTALYFKREIRAITYLFNFIYRSSIMEVEFMMFLQCLSFDAKVYILLHRHIFKIF